MFLDGLTKESTRQGTKILTLSFLFVTFLQYKDLGFVRIYYGVKRVVKRSVLDYTWLSAVAEIGGYVGLLLGIAVVDIAFAVDRYWLKITNFLV